jgi:hypothetical protein
MNDSTVVLHKQRARIKGKSYNTLSPLKSLTPEKHPGSEVILACRQILAQFTRSSYVLQSPDLSEEEVLQS